MAIAATSTLLSLDRFAQLMGINPAHFNQATLGTDVMPVGQNACSDLWFQSSWFYADHVGREDVAREIARAEEDLARELGWWPAPCWTSQDVRQFPKHYRPDVYRLGGLDVRQQRVGMKAAWGKIISPGRRLPTAIGGPSTTGPAGSLLEYVDLDGDGVAETARVTQTTTVTDTRELKVYFDGHSGSPEWEIRPARTKTITGGAFIATFWAWQFIDPDTWNALSTTTNATAIDASEAGNLVTDVDVYQITNDATQVTAQFMWEPMPRTLLAGEGTLCCCGGVGCTACQLTTQDGCLHVRNALQGEVVPAPADYSATDGYWTQVAPTCVRDPDMVTIWYYSGHLSERWLAGIDDDPLDLQWAQAIAWMATARLERPFCNCGVLTALANHLQEDLARVGETSHNVDFAMLGNPFGTRRGEIMAWQKVGTVRDPVASVAVG